MRILGVMTSVSVALCACGGSSGGTTSSTAAATGSTGATATSATSGGTTGAAATSTGGSTSGSTSGAGSSTGGGCPTTLGDGGLPAAPTWCNFALGFVDTYCLRCHEPAGAGLPYDFTTYSGAYDAGALIRCGVCVTQDPSWSCAKFPPAEQFPVSPPDPSDTERNEMVLWITNGAPQD